MKERSQQGVQGVGASLLDQPDPVIYRRCWLLVDGKQYCSSLALATLHYLLPSIYFRVFISSAYGIRLAPAGSCCLTFAAKVRALTEWRPWLFLPLHLYALIQLSVPKTQHGEVKIRNKATGK